MITLFSTTQKRNIIQIYAIKKFSVKLTVCKTWTQKQAYSPILGCSTYWGNKNHQKQLVNKKKTKINIKPIRVKY